MEIKILPKADEDLQYWKQTGNKRIMKRITKLLEDITPCDIITPNNLYSQPLEQCS